MTQRSTRANIPITMMFGQVPSLLQEGLMTSLFH